MKPRLDGIELQQRHDRMTRQQRDVFANVYYSHPIEYAHSMATLLSGPERREVLDLLVDCGETDGIPANLIL